MKTAEINQMLTTAKALVAHLTMLKDGIDRAMVEEMIRMDVYNLEEYGTLYL